jgi:hypothetical protein
MEIKKPYFVLRFRYLDYDEDCEGSPEQFFLVQAEDKAESYSKLIDAMPFYGNESWDLEANEFYGSLSDAEADQVLRDLAKRLDESVPKSEGGPK